MPLILRSVKGSKLSIPEMDGNLTYLASTLSGSVIQVTGSSMDASNTIITSSLFVGNLTGTASLASTASFSSTASYVRPLVQNVQITGSLLVSNSIDTSNNTLISSVGLVSVDWEQRALYDSEQYDSIDWENRVLKDTGAGSVVEWDTNLFQPSSDYLINLGDSSNRWRNTYISRNLYVGTINSESILTEGGLKLPTQSATPVTTPTHGNGTIAVGKNGGSYFIYVYLDNQWRSASLS